METSKTLLFAIPGLALLSAGCQEQLKTSFIPDKPNIILIIADDLAWDDTGDPLPNRQWPRPGKFGEL